MSLLFLQFEWAFLQQKKMCKLRIKIRVFMEQILLLLKADLFFSWTRTAWTQWKQTWGVCLESDLNLLRMENWFELDGEKFQDHNEALRVYRQHYEIHLIPGLWSQFMWSYMSLEYQPQGKSYDIMQSTGFGDHWPSWTTLLSNCGISGRLLNLSVPIFLNYCMNKILLDSKSLLWILNEVL